MLELGTALYSPPMSKPSGRPLDAVTSQNGRVEMVLPVDPLVTSVCARLVLPTFRPRSNPVMPSEDDPCICLKLVTAPRSSERLLKSVWARPWIVTLLSEKAAPEATMRAAANSALCMGQSPWDMENGRDGATTQV